MNVPPSPAIEALRANEAGCAPSRCLVLLITLLKSAPECPCAWFAFSAAARDALRAKDAGCAPSNGLPLAVFAGFELSVPGPETLFSGMPALRVMFPGTDPSPATEARLINDALAAWPGSMTGPELRRAKLMWWFMLPFCVYALRKLAS
jgi:hypothetical protein